MSILTPVPPHQSFAKRAFFAVPVIGWLARDVMYGDADNIWYLMVIIATALILAVAAWGLPALVVSALAVVPIYFVLMIVIASPWTPNA